MELVNHRTYQLLKDGIVILETEAATFDRAIDYFLEEHPDAYSSGDYEFKFVKRPHE